MKVLTLNYWFLKNKSDKLITGFQSKMVFQSTVPLYGTVEFCIKRCT